MGSGISGNYTGTRPTEASQPYASKLWRDTGNAPI